MIQSFEITIEINGKSHKFPATCIRLGYTYEFHVLVDQTTVRFEQDNEGKYRALLLENNSNIIIDRSILEAIANSLETIVV
jgi:hypothetical protein